MIDQREFCFSVLSLSVGWYCTKNSRDRFIGYSISDINQFAVTKIDFLRSDVSLRNYSLTQPLSRSRIHPRSILTFVTSSLNRQSFNQFDCQLLEWTSLSATLSRPFSSHTICSAGQIRHQIATPNHQSHNRSLVFCHISHFKFVLVLR